MIVSPGATQTSRSWRDSPGPDPTLPIVRMYLPSRSNNLSLAQSTTTHAPVDKGRATRNALRASSSSRSSFRSPPRSIVGRSARRKGAGLGRSSPCSTMRIPALSRIAGGPCSPAASAKPVVSTRMAPRINTHPTRPRPAWQTITERSGCGRAFRPGGRCRTQRPPGTGGSRQMGPSLSAVKYRSRRKPRATDNHRTRSMNPRPRIQRYRHSATGCNPSHSTPRNQAGAFPRSHHDPSHRARQYPFPRQEVLAGSTFDESSTFVILPRKECDQPNALSATTETSLLGLTTPREHQSTASSGLFPLRSASIVALSSLGRGVVENLQPLTMTVGVALTPMRSPAESPCSIAATVDVSEWHTRKAAVSRMPTCCPYNDHRFRLSESRSLRMALTSSSTCQS